MAQNFDANMRAAAFRHQIAAEELYNGSRRDVAGYLYGIAAECGIKALMLSLGMRPMEEAARRDDPFFAHFTKLKSLLRDDAQARRHEDLRKFTEDNRFMEHWDVTMRYSDGKGIKKDWVDLWRQNSKDVTAEI